MEFFGLKTKQIAAAIKVEKLKTLTDKMEED